MNYEIDKALHNYGYRYIGTIDNIRIYGKPIGYAILKAEINDSSITISLIVKGTQLKDGVRSNQIWKRKCEVSLMRRMCYKKFNIPLSLLQPASTLRYANCI